MSLQYMVQKNQLKSRGDNKPEYFLRTVPGRDINRTELVEQIAFGSYLNPTDVHAVLKQLETVVENILSRGERVDLGFVTLGSRVKGSFDVENPVVNRQSARIDVRAYTPTSLEKRVAERITLERVETSENPRNQITIRGLYNIFGEAIAEDSAVHPGDSLHIRGKNLGFDARNSARGVRFKSADGYTVIVPDRYSLIQSSTVAFQLPANMPAGTYQLEIHTGTEEEPAVTALDEPVQVVPRATPDASRIGATLAAGVADVSAMPGVSVMPHVSAMPGVSGDAMEAVAANSMAGPQARAPERQVA